MAKIIIIEDEGNIADLIRMNLEIEGHSTLVFSDGQKAADSINIICDSDLIVLDIMLPKISGLELANLIRSNSHVPILMLSAKGSTSDRISGLKAGANDYLPKPFDLEELLLRVQNLIPSREDGVFIVGCFTVNIESFECHDESGNKIHDFSKREVALLKLFNEKQGQVVSRDEILDRIWGKEQFPTSRTIDNYILTFRKIFEKNPREPHFFHSIRGVGYKFTS
jgi:two-component system alkaline phosphatase synthesis response regulator PhoP